MELNNFSIKGVVLGTKDLSRMTSKFLLKSFDYIETSVSYNNDYEIGLVLDKKTKVISRMSSLSQYDLMIKYHLKWLNRNKVDILLIDSKAPWKDEDFLSLFLKRGELFDEIGLTEVENLEDIKRIQKLGINPDWVDIIINPTNFNLELITYLKKEKIKILSHKVLGGYLAKTNIEVYTLQFLLSFSALYSDLVCISGHSCEEVLVDKMILEKCIDQPLTDDLKPIYLFSSSRIVKRSPLTPLPIYRYLSASNFILKINGPKDIYSQYLSMNADLEIIPEDSTDNMDFVEKTVNEYLPQIILPEDCVPDSQEAFAFWRYNVISMVSLLKGAWKYKYTYELSGNTFLIYRKRRYGFRKEKTSSLYILAMTEKGTLPLFRKIENLENSDPNP